MIKFGYTSLAPQFRQMILNNRNMQMIFSPMAIGSEPQKLRTKYEHEGTNKRAEIYEIQYQITQLIGRQPAHTNHKQYKYTRNTNWINLKRTANLFNGITVVGEVNEIFGRRRVNFLVLCRD